MNNALYPDFVFFYHKSPKIENIVKTKAKFMY